MLTATYDLTTGWAFDGEFDGWFGISIIEGDADAVEFTDCSFGYAITIDGVPAGEGVYPDDNVTVRMLQRNYVYVFGVPAAPDSNVTVEVWANANGTSASSETAFVVPRPTQPYPSWTWQDGAWTPPVEQEAEFSAWSEQRQEWVVHPNPEVGGYDWDVVNEQWVEVV